MKKPFRPQTQAPRARVNQFIKAPQVRVLADDGQQLGVFSLEEALRMAAEAEVDLVEISANANPPVTKLISYDKFKYQLQKSEQQMKKKAKKIEVKTIRLSAKIATNDIQTKAKQANGFLADGDWVRVELRLRGREKAFADVAAKQIQQFQEFLTHGHRIEVPLKQMGNALTLTLAPTK